MSKEYLSWVTDGTILLNVALNIDAIKGTSEKEYGASLLTNSSHNGLSAILLEIRNLKHMATNLNIWVHIVK